MRGHDRNSMRVLVAAALLGLPAGTALAGEGKTEIFATGYIFASAINGRASAFDGLPSANIDLSFGDVLDDLDGGIMSAIEVRNGRWGFLADVMYSQVSPVGTIPGPAPLSVELRQRSLTLQGNVLYRVHETPAVSVDVGAGLRYWRLDNQATSLGGGPLGPATERVSWVDPVLIARVNARLDGPWSLTFAGDIGGSGNGADLTWQLLGTVNYQKNDRLTFRAGYRILSVDYEDDGFVYDIRMQGPVIGVTYRF